MTQATISRGVRGGAITIGVHSEPSPVSCRSFVGGFDIYRAVCFSVVVAFIFFGRHVPECAVQAPIVVPIQPVEGEFFDVRPYGELRQR